MSLFKWCYKFFISRGKIYKWIFHRHYNDMKSTFKLAIYVYLLNCIITEFRLFIYSTQFANSVSGMCMFKNGERFFFQISVLNEKVYSLCDLYRTTWYFWWQNNAERTTFLRRMTTKIAKGRWRQLQTHNKTFSLQVYSRQCLRHRIDIMLVVSLSCIMPLYQPSSPFLTNQTSPYYPNTT